MKTITTTEMKTITTRGSGELVVDVVDNILKVGNYGKYGNFMDSLSISRNSFSNLKNSLKAFC